MCYVAGKAAIAEAWVTHLDYEGRSRGWVESEVLPLCSLF